MGNFPNPIFATRKNVKNLPCRPLNAFRKFLKLFCKRTDLLKNKFNGSSIRLDKSTDRWILPAVYFFIPLKFFDIKIFRKVQKQKFKLKYIISKFKNRFFYFLRYFRLLYFCKLLLYKFFDIKISIILTLVFILFFYLYIRIYIILCYIICLFFRY